jgi:hypothetical protein
MQSRATAALRKWDHQDLTTPSRSQVAVEALASIQQQQQIKTDDYNICWPVLIGAFIIQVCNYLKYNFMVNLHENYFNIKKIMLKYSNILKF